MISARYIHEQYHNDTSRLTRWLRGRPWAGPDHAEDLAQDAVLASLERERKGLKPRAMGYLAKDAAKRHKLLHDRSRDEVEVLDETGQKRQQRRKTLIRSDVEQQIDLTSLMRPATSPTLPDHLAAALELIRRIDSPSLQQAVQLVLGGADLVVAAQAVGMPVTSLRRALAAIGDKLGAQPRQRRQAQQDGEQMSLFAGLEV